MYNEFPKYLVHFIASLHAAIPVGMISFQKGTRCVHTNAVTVATPTELIFAQDRLLLIRIHHSQRERDMHTHTRR